jgi:putative ABC transport system substrate-binding protein
MAGSRCIPAIILALGLSGTPLTVEAQPAGVAVHTVGVLAPHDQYRDKEYPAFVEALRALGYDQGKNLRLLLRSAEGAVDRLPALAKELVDARPEVIVAINTPGTRAAIQATRQIPIVMAVVGDPVAMGFVSNLARPGGNVTGVSWQLDELIPKTLSLLHEMVPRAGRVDLVNQAGDPGHAFFTKVMLDAARSRGLESQALQVRDVDELVATIAGSPADAMLMLATPMLYARPERIAAAAIERRLPIAVTGGPARDLIAGGILCSYCASQEELFRRAADCIDRILHGAKPADLPVEQPLRYDFTLNLKTARALGLKVSQTSLLLASELIE